MTDHVLYRDEALVKQVTNQLLSHGHSVLQLFQFFQDEELHSEYLLNQLDLPPNAKVLSLGSGVGGMERYWQKIRPDLSFELVNTSASQLNLSLCKGKHILADAATYESDRVPFDCVVIAYVLGHVHPGDCLASAVKNCGAKPGTVMLYDVFDGTPRFNSDLHYNSPSLMATMDAMKDYRLRTAIVGHIPLGQFAQYNVPWVKGECTPALLIFEV